MMPINITQSEGPKPPPEPGQAPRRSPVSGISPAKEPKVKKSVSLATQKEIETWFLKMYGMLGMFLAPIKPELSNQILISAEKCAKANAALAMEDVRIRRAISAAMVTGIWSAVIMAHLPILLVLVSGMVTDNPDARVNSQLLMGMAQFVSGQDAESDDDAA
jgi:hypothetical protein